MSSHVLLPLLSLSQLTTPTLTVFFQETLSVPDVVWENLTEELYFIQIEDSDERYQVDNMAIQDIYLRLQDMSAQLDPTALDSIL